MCFVLKIKNCILGHFNNFFYLFLPIHLPWNVQRHHLRPNCHHGPLSFPILQQHLRRHHLLQRSKTHNSLNFFNINHFATNGRFQSRFFSQFYTSLCDCRFLLRCCNFDFFVANKKFSGVRYVSNKSTEGIFATVEGYNTKFSSELFKK